MDDVSSGGEPYGDIEQELRDAFDAGKASLEKWKVNSESNLIIFAAHALNPRYKFSLIREQLPDQADEIERDVIAWLKKRYPPTAQEAANYEEPVKPPGISLSAWNMGQRANRLRRLRQQEADITNDWDKHFSAETVYDPVDCPDRVLKWWKANAFQYPTCVLAVRDLFAIPAAEVDVERLFSEGRDAIGVRRMAMDASAMRIVQLMKSYYDLIDKEKRKVAQVEKARHERDLAVSCE